LPLFPSTIIVSPVFACEDIVFNPATAGIASPCATIAVCEVFPPMSAAKPLTNFSFIATVSARG